MKKDKNALRAGLESINDGGFSGLIKGTASAPKDEKVQTTTATSKTPTASKYGRMCAVVNVELQEKLLTIAREHRLTFKDVLEQAMQKAVDAYEAKNGEIKLTARKETTKLF